MCKRFGRDGRCGCRYLGDYRGGRRGFKPAGPGLSATSRNWSGAIVLRDLSSACVRPISRREISSCPLSPVIGTAFGTDFVAGKRAGVRGPHRNLSPLTPALSTQPYLSESRVASGERGQRGQVSTIGTHTRQPKASGSRLSTPDSRLYNPRFPISGFGESSLASGTSRPYARPAGSSAFERLSNAGQRRWQKVR